MVGYDDRRTYALGRGERGRVWVLPFVNLLLLSPNAQLFCGDGRLRSFFFFFISWSISVIWDQHT